MMKKIALRRALGFVLAAAAAGSAAGCLMYQEDIETRPEVVEVPHTLATTPGIALTAKVVQIDRSAGRYTFSGIMTYTGQPRVGYDGAKCAVFGDVKAQMGGVEVPITTGGWSAGITTFCDGPRFQIGLTGPHAAAPTLTISDPSKAFSLELGDALQLRTATLIDPPAQGYGRTDTIKVRWSHVADFAPSKPAIAVVAPGGQTGGPVDSDLVVVSGDTIQIPMSAVSATTGPMVLTVYKGTMATTCGGACQLESQREVEVVIQVRD